MTSSHPLPEKIGRYEVKGVLGEGGQGLVFKAYDPDLKCFVAIKGLNTSFITNPQVAEETRERIHREAIAARKVAHQNVAMLYDFIDLGDKTYLIMEYVEGKTLADILQEDRRSIAAGGPGISLEEKLRIMIEVCAGLARAHKLGVIHRDIKPDNIRLTKEGEAKILDFGLARVGDSNLTMNRAMGTPAYMSPEQWGTGGGPTHQSDIWACGVILYEMLAYRRPFEGDPKLTGWDRAMSIMQQALKEDPPPLKSFNNRVPEELKLVVERAIKKNPQERYQSVSDLSRELENADRKLQETKVVLQERARKEAAELEKAVHDRAVQIDSKLAGSLLDLADPVDKRLWVLFTRSEATPETMVERAKSYSGLIFELELIARQRQRLDEIAESAKQARSFRDQVSRLKREDAERTEAFDDFKLKEILALLNQVFPSGQVPTDVRGLRDSVAREMELRSAERKTVEQATELLNGGRLEQALEVAEGAGPSSPDSPRGRLRQLILDNFDQRRALTAELKEATELEKQNRVAEAQRMAESVIEKCESRPWLGSLRVAAKALAKRTEAVLGREKAATVGKKVEALLVEAKSLAQSGQSETALEKVEEVFRLDPGSKPALQLKQDLEEQIRRVRTLRQAESAERDGELRRAVDLARRAIADKAGGQNEIRKQLESLVSRVSAKISEADSLVREASSAQASGRIDDALAKVRRALEIHPGEATAVELKRSLEESLERARRQERLRKPFVLLWERRGLLLGLVAFLALASVGGYVASNWDRFFPAKPGRVWVDVAPWAEILWVREATTQQVVEVSQTIAPCWLDLPAGKYEIGFNNPFTPDQPLTVSVTVASGDPVTILQSLPGFDYETLPIDF